ncbi:MAG: DctP family TRAP transporter solute-binding subunit [Spirochaetaceae bacterium]|nr:MAG: DctP family TRAP transporter solute-binding subunit [Spirochaetaceae bacterium]
MRKIGLIVLCIALIGALPLFSAGSREAAEGAPVTLRFGVNGNTQSIEYYASVVFAETLERVSGGQMRANIFPGGQLGDAAEMVTQITMNELDIYTEPIGGAGISAIIPELGLLEMPYVVTSLDHLKRIMDSPWGQEMLTKLSTENNIRVLGHGLFGIRQTSSNRPLNTIDDFRGLRIRTPNSRAIIDWANAVGARPTPVAFAEVYLALQTGSVDAQENPLPTIESMKFYEVQSHIALTNHVYQDRSVLFSERRWQSLSEQQRGWVAQASQAFVDETIELTNKMSEDLIGYFTEQGVTITRPELAPFQRAMAPAYERMERELGKPGLISSLAQL